MTAWITAEAAAQRLGIKRASLYAYVSRGVLMRRRAPGGRGSLFDADEIEKLARRGRPRRAPGGAELVIESALTEISGDRLRYRGGEVTDPLRLHLDHPAVVAAGRAMVAGMVDCLPDPRPQPAAGPDQPAPDIALRLWGKICTGEAEGLLAALRAALVLLADHELAASTLAVRVAASVRADPYAAVATGLGALGGPLHGGASLGAEAMLAAAAGPRDAPQVVGDLLRRTGRVPGFGHFVYRAGDPRAVCLLDLVARGAPASARLAVAEAVLAEMSRRALPEPNIDFRSE